MFRAQIIIQFTNGQVLSYANKFLADKKGTDEAGEQPIYNRNDEIIGRADVTTPLFKGYPEFNYYYTGYGTDDFDAQNTLGKVKGDFEHLKAQVGGTGFLKFPEADKNHGDTEILERDGVKKMFKASEVVSIEIKEDWVSYPYGREASYKVDKHKKHFLDCNESVQRKLKGFDAGPDFNENKRYDTGYIPQPIVKDGVVVNASEFDEVVEINVKFGKEYYGVKNNKKSGTVFVKED